MSDEQMHFCCSLKRGLFPSLKWISSSLDLVWNSEGPPRVCPDLLTAAQW